MKQKLKAWADSWSALNNRLKANELFNRRLKQTVFVLLAVYAVLATAVIIVASAKGVGQ